MQKTELKFSHGRMKPAGKSLNVLWSWFNSFKTDLETYIYITLQEAIYDIDSVCSAAALVNVTPEPKPKPKNCLMAIRVCQGPERGRLGMAMAALALSLSLSSPTLVLQDCLTLALPKSTWMT